jgi:hypothetical protein
MILNLAVSQFRVSMVAESKAPEGAPIWQDLFARSWSR